VFTKKTDKKSMPFFVVLSRFWVFLGKGSLQMPVSFLISDLLTYHGGPQFRFAGPLLESRGLGGRWAEKNN
jgi:hypothetical protein